ncbi:MAG: protein kinase [Deltaproteobacteria bacterium]|nr:protein kinase [Deltaproteobacteria bacterium]
MTPRAKKSFHPIPFGKYLLLDRIAVGREAEFYLAQKRDEKSPEKPIVIKKMLPRLTSEEGLIKTFINEAKLAAFLEHRNIIKTYDFGTIEGAYFVAMEYLFGKSLRAIDSMSKQKERRISLGNALHVAAQICSGLDYAHKLKDPQGNNGCIIHRNICPDSVFVTYNGRIKLTDFSVSTNGSRDDKSQMDIMKGKLAYMSPQQVDGKTIDHRSDIFSTGILLYEMVTGKKMFDGETMQVFSRVRQARFDPPESIVDCQYPKVYEIINRALEKKPEKRYQSAGEMLADLKKVTMAIPSQPTAADLAEYMKGLFEERMGADKLANKRAAQITVIDVSTEQTGLEESPRKKAAQTDSPATSQGEIDTEEPPGHPAAQKEPVELSAKEAGLEELSDQEAAKTSSIGPPVAKIHARQPTDRPAAPAAPVKPSTDEASPVEEPRRQETAQSHSAGLSNKVTNVENIPEQNLQEIDSGRQAQPVRGSLDPDLKDKTQAKAHIMPAEGRPKKGNAKAFWYAALAAPLVVICAVSVWLFWREPDTMRLTAVESSKLEAAIEALEAERFVEAITLLEEVMAGNPTMINVVSAPYSRALQGRASGLIDADPHEAKALLLKAVELDQGSAKGLSQLGLIYLQEKDYTKAIQAYKKAADLDSQFAETFFNLGYLYAITKHYAKAEGMYGRVVELAPSFVDEALFNLAVVQKRLDKRAECIKNLKRAIKLNPKNKQAKRYLKSLKGT